MKKFSIFFIILLFCFSCNNNNPRVNPEKIYGKSFDFNSLPYGYAGLIGHRNINGVVYGVCGVYYKGKVLVYVYKDHIILDYFFSNLVVYEEVKNIPIGTSYEEIINKLGEPVTKGYRSDYNYDIEKNSVDDTLAINYYQKERWYNKITLSSLIVEFIFSNEGKLLEILKIKGI